MRTNEIGIDLRIVDFDCSPHDITRILGVEPTRIWHKGDPTIPGVGIRHTGDGWVLLSGLPDHESFASHITALLRHIEPYSEQFTEIGNKYYAEISCAIYLYDYKNMPIVKLTKHETGLLQRIGAEIDFDIYALGSPEQTSKQQPGACTALPPSQQPYKEFHDISLELRITGFSCTPQEITDALGVQPAYTWHHGKPHHDDTSQFHHDNGWAITSGLPQQEEFQAHMEALLGMVEPRIDAFTDICSRYRTELYGDIRMYYELEVSTPWIHLDKRAMGILARLGAEVTLHMTGSPADPYNPASPQEP